MTNANPLDISVLVAAYNVETYLDECLQSLHSQVNVNAEFIVVNDGSTDTTGQICDAYKAKDQRFRIIHKSENEGLILARKTGIENARGRYTVFLDGDDLLSRPEALSDIVREMDLANCDIGGYSVAVFGNRPEIQQSVQQYLAYDRASAYTSSLDILRALYGEQRVMGWSLWSKCYHTEVLKNSVEYIPEEHIVMAEDVFLVFLFVSFSTSFKVLNTAPITNYRFGTGVSTRQNLTADQFRSIAKSLRVIKLLNGTAVKRHLSLDHFSLIQSALIHLLRSTVYSWSLLPNEHKAKAFEYILQEGFYKETLYVVAELFASKDEAICPIMEGTANFINISSPKFSPRKPKRYKRIAHAIRDTIRNSRNYLKNKSN